MASIVHQGRSGGIVAGVLGPWQHALGVLLLCCTAEANGPLMTGGGLTGLTGSFDKAGPGGDRDVPRVTDEGAMCFMSFALATNA